MTSTDEDSSSEAYLTAATQSDRESSRSPSTFSREDSPATSLTNALDSLSIRVTPSDTHEDIIIAPKKRRAGSTQQLGVLLQPDCRLHRFTRTSNDADIVERPQRLRAINLGIAAAWARGGGDAALAVAAQVDRLMINGSQKAGSISGGPFAISTSNARLPLSSSAVAFVHDKPNEAPVLPFSTSSPTKAAFPSPSYPTQLIDWIRDANAAVALGKSEVPSHLPQGDLYWSAGSLDAVEGALGTCCEAVDEVVAQGGTRFAAIRPPGHHCASSSPSGFCLVNNVLVAAAHAHETHGVDRVVIFDIDLHHGDGTQSIVHRINAESDVAARASPKKQTPKKAQASPRNRRSPSPSRSRASSPVNDEVEVEARRTRRAGSPLKEAAEAKRRPLKLLYTSLHDIASFPCEDGDDTRVAAASMRINGGHGHYVCNVHLEEYTSEADFHERLYPSYRDTLFSATTAFLRKASANPTSTLFFISAGFDASEHEYSSMQRHGKRVPTSFFSRFASDLRDFSSHSSSRIVAILEGGYSDRALASGIASLLDGFVNPSEACSPWDVKTLTSLEKACDPATSHRTKCEGWMSTAQAVFSAIEGIQLPSAREKVTGGGETSGPSTPMALRERKPRLPLMLPGELETPLKARKPRVVSSAAVRVKREEVEVPPMPTLPSAVDEAPAVPVAENQERPTEEKAESLQTNEANEVRPNRFKLTFKAGGVQ